MASAFVITTATNTVQLGPDRLGEAAFTITNQTARAIRARSSVVALDPTQPAWLSVGGTTERNYPAGGTEQITVAIAVPPEAPAGRYTFRLDVVSVVLPDEDWAQGPVVACEVPVSDEPIREPEPEPRGYLETLLGAYAGGLPLGFIAAVLADNQGPGFIGLGIGSVIGAGLALRIRGFKDPWRTILPLAVLFLVWGLLVHAVLLNLFSSRRLSNDVLELIALLLAAIVAITLPALAGRAWARWRTTGGL